MNKRLQKFIPIILLLICLISLTGYQNVFAQTLPPDFLWAVSAGGNGYDAATDLAVDINGDIVVTGYFDSTASFGGISLTSVGSSDIFIAKYTNGGNVIWAVRAGGSSYDQPYSVTTDNLGNIIVTGIFNGSATFGTVTLNSFGNYDIFTAKYNSNGVFQWVHQGGGQNYDYSYEVTTDNLNNVIITGTYVQVASFDSISVQSGNPYGDIYVVKYNSLGAVQWVHNAYDQTGGQSFNNVSYGVRCDNNSNVFITGSFSNVITFGDTTLVSSFDGTNADIFLAKYDPSGNFNWVAQAGSDSSGAYSNGEDIRIDKDNNIIFSGTFSKMANFGNLPSLIGLEYSDIFIAKYDQSGNAIWAEQDHGSTSFNDAKEIDLDAAGNISLIASVAQIGGELNDIYFARYLDSGQKLWGIMAGLSNSNEAGGIANDSKGDIYGCGDFYSSGIFGTITLNGVNSDAFVAKLPSPKFSIVPNPVDFGSTPIYTLDSSIVNLQNTSTANLHISDISLVNDTSESFYIESLLDSVTALQSKSMALGFIPAYPGLKNAFVEITSDASTSPDTIFISGTGVIPTLNLSDSVLNFGSVDVGITSPFSLYMINSSIIDMLIDSVTIVGNDASNFSFSPNVNGDTLHLISYITLTVNFSPDTSGLKTAYLVVYSTASSSPDTVLLTGIGLSSILVQLPPSPNIGQPTTINITPPSSTPFTSSEIFYRKTGDLLYQQDTLSHQGNVYTYNIPPAYSTISGIQFYLAFSDGSITVTYPSINPDTNPASIQVSIPQQEFQNPIKTAQYQMLSIPLSINSPQIDSVFSDDYGPYDQKVWRIFRWQPQDSSYAEHNAIPGGIIPGNAYWLIDKDGKIFDVNNSLSVPAFNNYTIPLQPGYNQVGNPFAFSVSWFSIENSDSIPQLPILWNADTQDYDFDLIIYEPWQGYWIYNPLNHIINLSISPNLSLGKEKTVNYFASFKDDEFLIQLKASLKSSQGKDQQNYIGMKEDATSGSNKYNIFKPPAINDQIKVLIESDRNYFARNIVPVSKDGAYWDFTVETKSANQLLALAVDRKSSLPNNFNIWLLDKDRKIPIVLNNGTAEIMTRENGKSNFRIIVGTEDYAKLHSDNISLQAYEYALYQNYPNPFNPTTIITYQLKEKSDVTLEIFNILGERINSIVNNIVQDPGQHIVTWNGKNSSGEKVASGIYIYRIKADNFISSKKMILLK